MLRDIKQLIKNMPNLHKLAGKLISQQPANANLRIGLVNVALIALWLWLYRGVFPYLGTIFTRQEFRINQIVLLGVLVLVGMQIKKRGMPMRLDRSAQFYTPAIAMVIIGSGLYLLSERFLDINTLSATLFGLASYGLLGLWMQPNHWRRGLPAGLLLIGALPFGEHLQTFVGYPVRILTATIVGDGLAKLGIGTIGVDTILIFENGISKIDLPCSGVKSLWSGGLFLLAATWIERRSINIHWFLIGITFIVMLLAANLARVALLVSIGQIAGWRLLAEMLHVPLGVLGFGAACLLIIVLLRWRVSDQGAADKLTPDNHPPPARPIWLTPLLGLIILTMALLYTPRPQTASAHPSSTVQFPADWNAAPWALSSGEQEWLASSGVQGAERWRFQYDDLSGSLLFVSSNTWRSHHRPERCFEVYGLQTDSSYTTLIAGDFPIRVLTLSGEQGKHQLSAAYWLQSADQTTDDYATRIWDDLTPERQPWVLVTILFDEVIDPQSRAATALFQSLQEILEHSFAGGISS
jgi:exosortase O